MELHSDINRPDILVNEYRYLLDFTDYLYFIFILLLGLFLINKLIVNLKLNLILGHLINLYHLFFSFITIIYAEKYAHDGNSIYIYSKNIVIQEIFSMGTIKGSEFISIIIYPLVNFLELKLINIYLLFTFFSSVTLLLILSAAKKINSKNKIIFYSSLIIVLLPSFNFFISGLTKDNITTLIITYLLWLSIDNKFSENKISFMLCIILFILVRPYMGAILFFILIPRLLNINFNEKINFFKTIILFFLVILISYFSYYYFMLSFNIDTWSIDNIYSFIENRQRLTMTGYYYDITSTNILLRIFNYVFGPIGIFSNSSFELILVLENYLMFLLFIFCLIIIFTKKSLSFNLSKDFIFLTIYSIIMIFLLANVTANFGIIARTKYNFLLIVWFFIFNLIGKNFYEYRKK